MKVDFHDYDAYKRYYKEKVLSGDCPVRGCKEKLDGFNLCPKHRKNLNDRTKDRNIRGLCRRCKNPPEPGMAQCKECITKNRIYLRKYLFGISENRYLSMLNEQGHVCAICKRPERIVRGGKIQSLSVDHDHATGAIRGLLCVECNFTVGHVQRDENFMDSVLGYLEQFKFVSAEGHGR